MPNAHGILNKYRIYRMKSISTNQWPWQSTTNGHDHHDLSIGAAEHQRLHFILLESLAAVHMDVGSEAINADLRATGSQHLRSFFHGIDGLGYGNPTIMNDIAQMMGTLTPH